MGIPRIDTGPMTIEEFYAFTDTRPDEEKWELIDGEPVLNASPSRLPSTASWATSSSRLAIQNASDSPARGR